MKEKKQKFYGFKGVIRTILNVIMWTAFILVIGIGLIVVYFVITAKIYASKGIEYKPPVSLYMIVSPSMEPNIKVYDVVVNKKVDNINDLKVGDVITFISSSNISKGLTVTHRINQIIKTNEGLTFITKGDNNAQADTGIVTEQDIKGKVMIKIPQLGRVTSLLATKGGWFVLVLLPALGVIIYDILKLFKLFNLKDDVVTLSSKKTKDEFKKRLEEERKKELIEKLKKTGENCKNINIAPMHIPKKKNKK